MIEITTLQCRQIERAELRHRARGLQRKGESRIFLRRTWVLFSLAVLGLGVWDSTVANRNPMRGTIIVVGAAISTLMLGVMVLHDRQDRISGGPRIQSILKDAEVGEYQRIRVGPILAALKVTGGKSEFPAYLLKTATDAAYLSGECLNDAIDEYHYQQLAAGIDTDLTFASELCVEVWPIAEEIRFVELSGDQIAGPVIEIPIDELPVEQDTQVKVIPVDALPLSVRIAGQNKG